MVIIKVAIDRPASAELNTRIIELHLRYCVVQLGTGGWPVGSVVKEKRNTVGDLVDSEGGLGLERR